MKSKEKLFDAYLFIIYSVSFPLFIIVSMLYFFVLKIEEVSPVFFRIGIIGLLISILISLISFVYLYSFIKINKLYLEFIKAFVSSLFILPALLVFSIAFSNVVFDNSQSVLHYTDIIYKKKSKRIRKAHSRDSFYLYIKPQKPGLENVSIKVNKSEFENFDIGDQISFETKPGFWGIEYMDFSKK